MWNVVVGLALFFGGIFSIVGLMDGSMVDFLGSKIYRKPVEVPVFENEEIIIPYEVDTRTVFDDNGLSTIYTYHLKYVESVDGKQYNFAPKEIIANGKKYKTTPGFLGGVYIETREPIEELKIDGYTFKPGKTSKPKWVVDWQATIDLQNIILLTSVVTIFAGLFIMII